MAELLASIFGTALISDGGNTTLELRLVHRKEPVHLVLVRDGVVAIVGHKRRVDVKPFWVFESDLVHKSVGWNVDLEGRRVVWEDDSVRGAWDTVGNVAVEVVEGPN